MWKSIKPVLAQIFTSKKALAMLAGAIVWALAQAGVIASPEAILPLLGILSVYIFGQGIADNGKEATKVGVASLGKPKPSPTESE
jgi:hypothetical protein